MEVVAPEKGLTTDDVNKKMKIYGPNVLTEKKKTPWFVEYAKENTTFFALMLWAGAGFSFLAYGLDQEDPSTVYYISSLHVLTLFQALLSRRPGYCRADYFDQFILTESEE